MIRRPIRQVIQKLREVFAFRSFSLPQAGEGRGQSVRYFYNACHTGRQRGVSLFGLIVVLIILAFIAVMAMKIVPAVVEYRGIVKAVQEAKSSGTTVLEIRQSYDRRAEVGYLESIRGYDLEITNVGNGFEVSFAYEKKIPLVGPASLLLEFSGTTASSTRQNPTRKIQ